MPVEIRELLIQAKVKEDATVENESIAGDKKISPTTELSAIKEQIIQECLERMEETLKARKLR